MNTKKTHLLLATLMSIGLGACSSPMDKGQPMHTSDISSTPSASATASDTSAPSTTSATSSAASDMNKGAAGTSAMWNGVVQNIETIPRSQTGAMANAATGTTTDMSGSSSMSAGAGAASDMAYRITVRLDDGSTKMMTQDTQPSFKVGDKVHMANDALQLQAY